MPSPLGVGCIPEELASRRQWICWAWELNAKGERTKVPRRVGGGNASSTDPASWTDLQTAYEAYLGGKDGVSGIGFVFAPDCKITGLDLDHVLDEDGVVADAYRWVVDEAGTYTEVSPSGDGLHLMFSGGKPEGLTKCKKAQADGRVVEMYDHGRFFTFTCNVFEGRGRMASAPDVLRKAYETWIEPKEADAPVTKPSEASSAQPSLPMASSLDDESVYAAIHRSAKVGEIRALFQGDASSYNYDESAADLALCNHLAFFTQKNPEQMDRMFRKSGLMRPKWDSMRGGVTYGQMTIERAIADTKDVYNPNYGAPPHKPEGVSQGRQRAPLVNEIVAVIEGDKVVDALNLNEMDKRPYVRGVLPWNETGDIRPFENADRSQLFAYLQNRLPKMKSEDFNRALDIIFDNHRFDPVQEMFLNLPKWDGTPRVGFGFQTFLGADDTEYTREVERLVFRALYRRSHEPGAKFDIMTVLVGEQGIGKSAYCRAFALEDRFFLDNVYGIGTPTASTMVQGKTVVEVAELAAFSKKEVEITKSWITQQSDDYVPKYVKDMEHHPRRFVLFGSTNKPQFLIDETGNRRFAPITCDKTRVRKPLSEIHDWMIQAWAEALELFANDDKPLVFPENVLSALSAAQEGAKVEDARVGFIAAYLDGRKAGERICVAQIVQECLEVECGDARYKSLTREVGDIMGVSFPQWKRLEKKKSCGSYGTQRVYELLPDLAKAFEVGNGEIGCDLPTLPTLPEQPTLCFSEEGRG